MARQVSLCRVLTDDSVTLDSRRILDVLHVFLNVNESDKQGEEADWQKKHGDNHADTSVNLGSFWQGCVFPDDVVRLRCLHRLQLLAFNWKLFIDVVVETLLFFEGDVDAIRGDDLLKLLVLCVR